MADELTNFELLLTRGRALGISFVMVEQVPSELSRAARVCPHFLAAFCTTGAELRQAVELLGLRDRRAAEGLTHLGKGECIVTITGDRCATPLKVQVPFLNIERRNLTPEERRFFAARSLGGLLDKLKVR